MGAYSIAETKSQLSALVGMVEHGEAVTITKRGIPVAKIVPINAPASKPKLDLDAIRKIRESMPYFDISSVDLVRMVREGRIYD